VPAPQQKRRKEGHRIQGSWFLALRRCFFWFPGFVNEPALPDLGVASRDRAGITVCKRIEG
jgi:hypothetical protein